MRGEAWVWAHLWLQVSSFSHNSVTRKTIAFNIFGGTEQLSLDKSRGNDDP